MWVVIIGCIFIGVYLWGRYSGIPRVYYDKPKRKFWIPGWDTNTYSDMLTTLTNQWFEIEVKKRI